MRVGLVSFAWAPLHAGGLRSHVQDLARSLVADGDQVFVHCVNTDPEAPPFVTRSWMEGPVHVQGMNYAYQDLQCLMGLQRVPQAEVILQAWVAQHRLDLVDVQHTLFVGFRALPVLAAQVPTLATLHDYWPLDPHAQLFAGAGGDALLSADVWTHNVRLAWPSVVDTSLEASAYAAEAHAQPPNGEPDLMRAWISYSRRCLASCQRLITPSPASAAVFERYGIDQPITVVENGIDAEALRPGITAEPAQTRPRGSRVQLGLLGNIAPAKGQLAFCRACLHPELAAIVQVHLHGQLPAAVHGSTEAQQSIQALWQGHPDLLQWHGPYERSELAAIFASLDLLVMPSLWEEVYGLIAREALCYGLPLIVTNAGALAELEGRSHVFMLNREDPQGWADVLLEGFQTGPLYRWVYERRQRRSPPDAEVRSSAQCASELRSLYADVLAESARF
jgi:glycosyltransferase involved in cell wall biosynthesis